VNPSFVKFAYFLFFEGCGVLIVLTITFDMSAGMQEWQISPTHSSLSDN
jgi:preprotein translocase subunit SecY